MNLNIPRINLTRFMMSLKTIYRKRYFYNTMTQENVEKTLNVYASYHLQSISLQQIIDFGKNLDFEKAVKSTTFLKTEVCVRIAHIVKELEHLPKILLRMNSVQLVRKWYLVSFTDLIKFPTLNTSQSKEEITTYMNDFCKLFEKLVDRHAPMAVTMAQGIMDLHKKYPEKSLELPILYFLDRFYTSRISIRFLVRHHIEVYKSFSEKRKDPKRRATLVGLVDTDCIVKEILEDAYRDASFLSQQHYTQSPELKIVCPQDIRNFTYIPLHLYYIFFELLKNSLRAVIEFHKDKNELPCIQAIIVKGAEDLSIKISDQGGGIPRSDWLSVNSYMFSTANKIPELSISPTFDINNAPLAGYGFGLPLSRLYAKYLGGDLQIISLENYGTDAYIHLKATAKDSSEVLPAFSPAAIKNYSSIIPLKWKILK